jgi:micrococcal nuclease
MRRFSLFLMVACLTAQLTPGHVLRTIDGDTFALYHVGTPPEERVRVLGVNTPERGQPNAAEATAFTRAWLAKGPFTLTACKRDSFGRLLGTVERDGGSLSRALIDAGLAVPYRE